jgi:hypothetical protein
MVCMGNTSCCRHGVTVRMRSGMFQSLSSVPFSLVDRSELPGLWVTTCDSQPLTWARRRGIRVQPITRAFDSICCRTGFAPTMGIQGVGSMDGVCCVAGLRSSAERPCVAVRLAWTTLKDRKVANNTVDGYRSEARQARLRTNRHRERAAQPARLEGRFCPAFRKAGSPAAMEHPFVAFSGKG